ncbi:MAG: DinB family protein [Actinomycetales bacterium]
MPLETPEQVLKVLRASVPRLEAAAAAVPPDVLQTPPGPDEWSANDVLAHLRSCSDVWGSTIVRIVDEDTPTIRAVNPRTWIAKTDYPEQTFSSNLTALRADREQLLALLTSLPEEAWSRAAVVTGAGKTLRRSVLGYAEWLASHERPHLKQVERVVGLR